MPASVSQSRPDDLLVLADRGLFCQAGNFYVDPWLPVERAILTHAHSDHARPGSGRYLVADPGLAVMRERLGSQAQLDPTAHGATRTFGRVKVSLHPAGHVLGSAQIRIEGPGAQGRHEVWVVTGDYKRQPDPTCAPFEPLTCDVFITESTFGLPIYRWEPPETTFAAINEWWRDNRARNVTSVVFAYALGKAQRVMTGIDPSIGPILTHGAITRINRAYQAAGVALPSWQHASPEAIAQHKGAALVIAPPSAANTPWLRRFRPLSDAFASGWMRVRGTRRRRSIDRGFVLSDHVDWPDLLRTIRETGASRIGVTHGYTGPVVRYVREQLGLEAWEIPTRFEGEGDEAAPESTDAGGAPADDRAAAEGETHG